MSSQWRAMAFDIRSAFSKMKRFKPHLLMIMAQMCYTLLYFITKASFNKGLNPHVYVTYRHVLGGLVVSPFAYFLERKVRPKLTLALFLEIFLLSLLGIGFTVNMYFASLRYTSTTFVTSMVNTVSSLTFIVAVILRMEFVDVRNPRGIAKIVGTIISLAGVMIMILYKGQAMQRLKGDLIHIGNNSTHEDWIKGSILTVTSCISWSVWYIMQGFTLKKYPAQLSLTVWINCIGGAQSGVFTVLIQHKPAAWSITSAIDFLSIIYGGAVCCGLTLFLQLYCIRHKGPVFVTIFNPLSTVMVTTLAYFVAGEKLYMGRILGGAMVIAGLYALLWGKEKDQECINTQQKSVLNKEPGKQISSPAETEEIP
ncbi:hypothetical protein QYF36_010626 [Acer negundo]|nr:hypothetical protein QYF36_010626 [Acer negundo]